MSINREHVVIMSAQVTQNIKVEDIFHSFSKKHTVLDIYVMLWHMVKQGHMTLKGEVSD